ncbi:MAG: NUDIX domain-containing protein [Treponema sp.]|jgi:ADP-ribose pyrophosphatase YjhB (NUDIX family)|nr:NUDIX domain-containing protein [Treponema sp.]
MFRYCPACASEKIRFEQCRVNCCPECGFTYYHNTAAATGCIIRTNEGLLFIIRGREPGKGKLDLPGGFVDPGEGAMDGMRREIIEELGIDYKTGDFKLFASFPNKYFYKNISYNTCDLFFHLDVPDLTEKDLHPDSSEISAVRFIKTEELELEQIAFESVKKAICIYLDTIYLNKHG